MTSAVIPIITFQHSLGLVPLPVFNWLNIQIYLLGHPKGNEKNLGKQRTGKRHKTVYTGFFFKCRKWCHLKWVGRARQTNEQRENFLKSTNEQWLHLKQNKGMEPTVLRKERMGQERKALD